MAVVGLLVVAGPASAAVTTSNVTVPADLSFIHFDSKDPQISVQGTSDGVAGDTVDLYCTNGTGTSFTAALLKATVPVTAGGGFTYSGTPGAATQRACVIRAVPAGAAPTAATNLGTFTGPRTFLGEEQAYRDNGGINDYFVYNSQTQGGMDYLSLGECGLTDSYVYDPVSLAKSKGVFDCNAYLEGANGSTGAATRSELQVDGRNAYLPASAYTAFTGSRNVPGFLALSYRTSFSPTSGDMNIQEDDPVVTCPGAPYPPTPATCPRFEREPVDVHRTITMDHLGRMARIVDSYSSRDGAAHTVDLQYEQDFRDSMIQAGDPAYLFPWRESTFSQHALLDSFAGPGGSSTGSIFVKANKAAPDGDTTDPQGAITYSAPPDRVTFLNFGATRPNAFWSLNYRRRVPPSGALTLGFGYSQAFLAADVATLARDAEAALAPVAAGGGTPVPGSGTTGGAGSGGGGGGAGGGGSGSAFRGVSLRGHRLSVARGRLLLRLACPSRAVKGCRGTATLYSKTKAGVRPKRRKPAVVYGSARFSITVHRTRGVHLKLSRAGRKALSAKHGKLGAVLNIQARDRARRPNLATTSTTVTLVTKKPKTSKRSAKPR